MVGFEGLYSVSSLGRVRSEDRVVVGCTGVRRCLTGKVLRPTRGHPGGYAGVTLYKDAVKRSVWVHRLVLEAFVGPCPEGMEVCHTNGVSRDNRVENLRWDTRAANAADRIQHGTVCFGATHVLSKLTEPAVREMRVARTAGATLQELADRYDVAVVTVRRACHGIRWGHIEGAVDWREVAPLTRRRGAAVPGAKLDDAKVLRIRRLGRAGVQGKDIAAQFCISRPLVSRILSRKTWKHITDEEAA